MALSRRIVPITLGFLTLLLALSLWAMAGRESGTRRLVLEYRMHRTMSALAELWRIGELDQPDLEGIAGFGLYLVSGGPLYRYGQAPESIRPEETIAPDGLRLGPETASLVSVLGRSGQMRSMGSMMRPRDPAMQQPALAFISVDAAALRRAQASIVVVTASATLVLAALFGFSLILFRKYERSREREERNRELVQLGQAARTIAHEIKNPLGVIRIQCGVLKKREGADRAGLAIIEDEADRLAGMADRIRAFLSSPEPSLAGLDLAAFASAFAARYAGALGYDPERAPSARVLADQALLSEAMDNLVANALEAGGAESPTLELALAGGFALLSVSDRGGGVQDAARLFEPFYSTKHRGTGLGLALARKHARSMGGDLSWARRPGGGSVFSLSLPRI